MPRAPKCSAAAKVVRGEVLDDRVLKAGDEVEGLRRRQRARSDVGVVRLGLCEASCAQALRAGRDRGLHAVSLDVAAHGGLDAAEGEVEARASSCVERGFARASARCCRWPCALICAKGNGTAAGSPCAARASIQGRRGRAGRAAWRPCRRLRRRRRRASCRRCDSARCRPAAAGEVKVRVAAADDQREQRRWRRRRSLSAVHQHGVDVAFEMVDGDQRDVERRSASALAKVMPTSSAPARPGPSVTAMASRSA